MTPQKWFGYALVAMFAIRAATLFPFYPPVVLRQWAFGMEAELGQAAMDDLEISLWISFWVWIVVLPTGIASGVMAIRDVRRWPVAMLISAALYTLAMRPWQWTWFYAEAMSSFSRLSDRLSWIKAGFVFDTLVFPVFVAAAALCSIIVLFRRCSRA